MEIQSGDYFLYGFIPTEDADHASIAPLNSSYSNGAVLTIHDLDAVTPSDVCVIIGAKEGTDVNTPTGLQRGQYQTHLNPTGTSSTYHNYIFLLFDHLYSALRFNYKVDAEYAKLRTIKLRKLELIAYSDDSGGAVKAKYNVVITLRQNTTGDSPIASVNFTPDTSSGNVAPVPLYDWDGDPSKYLTLKVTEPTAFMGTFVPGDMKYFKLRSTYDVFDKNVTNAHPEGNLIREGCQAENTIDLRKKFGSYLSTTRGSSYSYTITVQPTYLYMLSEPDLDNPTVTIN